MHAVAVATPKCVHYATADFTLDESVPGTRIQSVWSKWRKLGAGKDASTVRLLSSSRKAATI
jgi:hypothetical protein